MLLKPSRDEIDGLRERGDDWERRARNGTEEIGKLTREFTDLLIFAEAFAEELEGRRGAGRPVSEILADYREQYPFD